MLVTYEASQRSVDSRRARIDGGLTWRIGLKTPGRSKLAVMFTDVVGFTSRMERDETDAMQILSRIEKILQPRLDRNKGSLIKVMGDGTLSVFPNPPLAVRCAREFQSSLKDADFRVRVGIHWGDVLHDRGDIFGDTVNIASRLEKIAVPGGICISREMLNNYVAVGKPRVQCLGLHKLKGLGRLIELFAVSGSRAVKFPEDSLSGNTGVNMSTNMDETPSVAVTLLENLGHENDAFYAYGISSDLVSDLTRAGLITVAPLTEVMTIQGADGFIRELEERFETRYLVKGSLWKEGSVFRLSVELQDIRENRLVWTDNWQDDWYELPSIKGKLADSLLKALGIEPSVFPGIIGNISERTNAYELYLRGKHIYHRRSSAEDLRVSRKALEQAVELDPELVQARVFLGGTYRDAGDFQKGRQILEDALAISRRTGDPVGQLQALNGIGITLWKQSHLKDAGDAFRKVLSLAGAIDDRDGESRALNNLGLVEWNQGRLKKALAYFNDSLKISRRLAAGLLQARTLCNIGLVHASEGDDIKALDFYQRSLDLPVTSGNLNTQIHILINMGSAYFRSGSIEKALSIALRCLRICRELDDRPGQCKTLNNLGNIMLYLGCFAVAGEYFEEAMVIAESQNDRFISGIIHSGMGLMKVEKGEIAEGVEHFLKSIEICRTMDDVEGEGELLFQLGEAYMYQGRMEEAASLLRSSLEKLEAIGSTNKSSLIKGLLASSILMGESSSGAEEEVISLLQSAEDELGSQHRRDAVDIIQVLAKTYRTLLDRRGEDIHGGSRFALKYRTLAEMAYRSLVSSADRIEDSSYRECYLNRVDRHRNIASAFTELQDN